MRLEGLGLLKKIDLIEIRTRDLPACSIMPQRTTLPRVPVDYLNNDKFQSVSRSSTQTFTNINCINGDNEIRQKVRNNHKGAVQSSVQCKK
jgi:hypothetical protein